MTGSTRSSTVHEDSDHDRYHEKNVNTAPGKKQSLLGVGNEDLAQVGPDAVEAARKDGKVELTEDDAYDKLGYSLPEWRKWSILILILLIQTSMNSNASMYGFAVEGITEEFGVSAAKARLGQALFLIFYAFGCELWAPWSEELGRWPTQQLSLFLVNIWQILSALAPNFGTILVARCLGGLSTAGGSVTLGVIADLYQPEDTGFQYAVAFVILSSVGGAPIGAVIGGFVGYQKEWYWIFWTLLIMGGIVQAAHFILVPETRATILLDREAKKRRKNGDKNIYGPNELRPFKERFSMKEVGKIWWRPWLMFFTEPIVLFLSLLSGFSDSLIFTFLEAYTPVFEQWDFKTWQIGLCFLS
jgi:MFS family permease